MENYILVRGARQLLTLHGHPGPRRGQRMRDLGIVEDGSVLIRNSEILALGPTRRIENLKEAKNAAVISAAGRVVMPGFVDTKLDAMPGEMGRGQRHLPASRVAQDAGVLLRSALQHGTTRAEVKVGGLSPSHDLRFLRHAKRLDPAGRDCVRTWLIRPDRGENANEAVGSRKLVFEWLKRRASAAFLEIDADEGNATAAAALASAALRYGFPYKLAWRGAVSHRLSELLEGHCFHTATGLRGWCGAEAGKLASKSTIYVFTGGVDLWNLRCGAGARELIDADAAVAIASGYDSIRSPVFNIQMVIAQAVAQLRLTTEEAITAATINAAYASGIGEKTGSLEFKKQADLLLLNLSDYRELPRQFGLNHVGMVIRSGSVVFNRIGWKAAVKAS